MGAILPFGLLLIHQAKPRFVDQGGALQGVVAAQMAVRQPAQLAIDQRRERSMADLSPEVHFRGSAATSAGGMMTG